jgi:hypothetical protein
MAKEQPGSAYRLTVNATQPPRAHINRLWRALKSHPQVLCTGLGQALYTVAECAQILNSKGLVNIESIQTGAVEKDNKHNIVPFFFLMIVLCFSIDCRYLKWMSCLA